MEENLCPEGLFASDDPLLRLMVQQHPLEQLTNSQFHFLQLERTLDQAKRVPERVRMLPKISNQIQVLNALYVSLMSNLQATSYEDG